MDKNKINERSYKEAIIECLEKVELAQEELIPMCIPILIMNLHRIVSVYESLYAENSNDIQKAFNLPTHVMTVRIWKFLTWLLDQKVPEDERESGALWYDEEVIAELWDEFMTNIYEGI